jgi:hypothetical protein
MPPAELMRMRNFLPMAETHMRNYTMHFFEIMV